MQPINPAVLAASDTVNTAFMHNISVSDRTFDFDRLLPLEPAARLVRLLYGDEAIYAAITRHPWHLDNAGSLHTSCDRCVMAEIAVTDYERPVPHMLLAALTGLSYHEVLRGFYTSLHPYISTADASRFDWATLAEQRKFTLAAALARIIRANDFALEEFGAALLADPRQVWLDTFFPEGVPTELTDVNAAPAGALLPSK